MPAPISREYRIYLALWRKALLGSEIVEIKAPSRSMAIAMRQGMYRAIRPFRSGKMVDEELRQAAEKYVVFLDEEKLILRERMTLSALETEIGLDVLGIDEEDLLLGDERALKIELEQILEIDEKPVAKSSTPFYTR
jgi:hypothetical protein